MTQELTEAQAAAFHRFRKKLERHLPAYRIAAVSPYNENIIEVWLESIPDTYRKGLKACKLAVEVADETGIHIILR